MSLFSQMRSLVQGIFGDKSSSEDGESSASGANTNGSKIKAPVPLHGGRILKVSAIREETDDARSITFVDPKGGSLKFEAGQFFTLVVPVGKKSLKRAYSVSSPAQDSSQARVTVKAVKDGKVSPFLVRDLQEGAELEVIGPSGMFTVPKTAKRLVLIGGGSGITPLLSIIHTQLAEPGDTKIELLFGNRSLKDIIFKSDLDELAAKHPERLKVVHVLEDSADSDAKQGLLDRANVTAILEELGALDDQTSHYFVCGPLGMMDEAKAAITARDVPLTRFKEERFVSLSDDLGSEAEGSDQAQEVTFSINGREKGVFVRPGQTILEAGLDDGLELPNSCTVGGCGTCRVKLAAGRVAMSEPNCLDPDERAQGYILACCSKPLSPCRVEVQE